MKITIDNKESLNNIFHNGNVVQHKDTEIIILVTGESDYEYNFEGMVLHHFNKSKLFVHEDDWKKDQFLQFYGSVTLEN